MQDPMLDLEIKHREERGGGAFILLRDQRQVGELFYTNDPDGVAVIEHTEVDPSIRRQGAGMSLVEAAVAWARASGKKIEPVCRFAKAAFARHPELRDVLASRR